MIDKISKTDYVSATARGRVLMYPRGRQNICTKLGGWMDNREHLPLDFQLTSVEMFVSLVHT